MAATHWLATTMAALGLFGTIVPAAAQRDAGDRGLRLDHDEMRNEIRQDRLRPPSPGVYPVAPVPLPPEPKKTKKKQSKTP